jgi:hypothetical protein
MLRCTKWQIAAFWKIVHDRTNLPRLPVFLELPEFAQCFWHCILVVRAPVCGLKKISTKKEVIMLLSKAITDFVQYQKVNSGKKYGQELLAFPG